MPDKTRASTAPAGFPFTGIVGQEDLKLALLLAVIDPGIGGVLITGHRGTAKSTAVRALATLLPPMRAIEGCPYRCDPAAPDLDCPSCSLGTNAKTRRRAVTLAVPVVDLPLGATEDRVVGSVDIERALIDGVQAFSPGLLAAANRGFLYIDEVNLLEDHLVDLLLDVAVSGVNVVEREGLSIRHAARFVLVGSGNPEEGDLRPQLLDRFGLQARITTIVDVAQRIEIVRRRMAFERNARTFAASREGEQDKLRRRLRAAIRRRDGVALSDAALSAAARLCEALAIDGHRGELAACRAAVALAAFDGRRQATPADVARVAPLALAHRLRKDPLEPAGDDERVRRVVAQVIPA
jgi:magnesium chelatase subunit I